MRQKCTKFEAFFNNMSGIKPKSKATENISAAFDFFHQLHYRWAGFLCHGNLVETSVACGYMCLDEKYWNFLAINRLITSHS
jgi:hypothetical protein